MGSCCPKPSTKIVKVGTSQAGVIGLDEILKKAMDEGLTEKSALENELVALARDHGNYIATSAEGVYKEALLREFREYCRQQQPPAR